MSQRDVIVWLENQREKNNKFYDAGQVKLGLMSQGLSESAVKQVYNNLRKLAVFNMIEWKGKGIWDHKKVFRAKKECE